MLLDTPIEYLKGVGPARATLLQRELCIFTYGDLLEYFPFRHVDRTHVTTISEIDVDEPYIVLKGHISEMHTIGNGRTTRLSAILDDGTGRIELIWFQGVKWVKERIKPDTDYLVMGKPTIYNGHINIAHPDIEDIPGGVSDSTQPSMMRKQYMPVYSTSEKLKSRGLNSKGMAKLTEQLLAVCRGHVPETLPSKVLEKYRLPGRGDSIEVIHYPRNMHDLALATQRMKFEELFFLQLERQYSKLQRQTFSRGLMFGVVGKKFNRFYSERLPFELTAAQKRVVKEIRADMRSGRQMNRLLQGDVGSGKTLVALLSMLIAVDNGCQACLMAPTEILATQHYESLTRLLEGVGVSVELLTGSLKASAKKKIKERLASGETDILTGTHALIEKDVQFRRLGLVVIDEQHRFGVEQRSQLWSKGSGGIAPHILVMTATPIPRTLAMTLYGDLDLSVIDELPPGRHPVQTLHCTDAQRLKVFSFIRKQIAQGRQIYIVYPLIEESPKMELKDLMDGYESIVREFPLPHYQISIVHGQMSAEAKNYEMDRFKSGQTNIMVSTTVIEVGVDVPNATVMVIENAERFGLSQLHQLRGRVGRGAGQSFCILMTADKLSTNARERIATMVATTDGFKIAEADLRLRGPGDISGLQQSGEMPLKIADLVGDERIVVAARDSVDELLRGDPTLDHPDNAPLKLYLQKNKKNITWSKIS